MVVVRHSCRADLRLALPSRDSEPPKKQRCCIQRPLATHNAGRACWGVLIRGGDGPSITRSSTQTGSIRSWTPTYKSRLRRLRVLSSTSDSVKASSILGNSSAWQELREAWDLVRAPTPFSFCPRPLPFHLCEFFRVKKKTEFSS